jgi:hypothetical protein
MSVNVKDMVRVQGLQKVVVWLPATHKNNLKDLSDISQSSMGIYGGVVLKNALDGLTKIAINVGQPPQRKY